MMNGAVTELSRGDARAIEATRGGYDCHRARWSKTPVLQLHPHWTWPGREGQEIFVWVHTNSPHVELFLNGRSQGSQATRSSEPLGWKVKYEPGRLVARGLHRSGPLEAVQETAGAPVAIRLTAGQAGLTANNADLAVVRAEVIDAKGRVVPFVDHKIAFKVAGPARLLGVGNGEPAKQGPDQAGGRPAFHGVVQAILQATLQEGVIRLVAESPGLKGAGITLRSRSRGRGGFSNPVCPPCRSEGGREFRGGR
jgi:beta-galactosidase